jgi:hypothetical protein
LSALFEPELLFRVACIFTLSHFVCPQSNKAQIRLKISQLYRADGFAVRELLKIADLLYKATMSADFDDEVSLTCYFCSFSSIFVVIHMITLDSIITRRANRAFTPLQTCRSPPSWTS